jgi:hypothetical protein
MKIVNTTPFPNAFLRRMTGWCARYVEHPVSAIREAKFTKTSRGFHGLAWRTGRRFLVRVGPPARFPIKHAHAGFETTFADPTEALVHITLHEVYHLRQYRLNLIGNRAPIEQPAERRAVLGMQEFRGRRAELMAAWGMPEAAAAAAPEPEPEPEPEVILTLSPRIQARAERAQAALDRWSRKLKLAQTKVRKYRQRVRYYERRSAARPGSQGR